MPICISTADDLKEQLTPEELRQLVVSFRTYKEYQILPQVFGRDEIYTEPYEVCVVELRHIHLKDKTSDWSRARSQDGMTSDTALVYTRGTKNRDHYLLVTILEMEYIDGEKIGAHAKAKDDDIMLPIAEIADAFRKSN